LAAVLHVAFGVRRGDAAARASRCPSALTYDEIAATLSQVLGRPIAHVRIDLPTFQGSAASGGLPPT
jgi:uncharacterized protein YbjT (DUF2867 family)